MADDPNAPEPTSASPPERERGAVWAALDEAVRTGVRARAGWWLGLLVPTFAVRFQFDGDLLVTDRLGHFNPMPEKSRIGFDDGVLELAPLGMVFALIWIRVQAQALAGLLVGLDRRVDAFAEGSEVSGGQLWSAAGPVARDAFWILTARYLLGLVACAAVFAIPTMASLAIDRVGGPHAIVYALLAVFVAFGFLYLAILEVAANLALVSVVSNRRGPLSAFQHAWRLMTTTPREALRAGLAHFAIVLAVTMLIRTAEEQLGGGVAVLALILLAMGSGVAHACLWDRVYTVLGGVRSLPPLPVASDRKSAAEGAAGGAPSA